MNTGGRSTGGGIGIGIGSSLGEKLGDFSFDIVFALKPLNACRGWGMKIADAGPRVRGWLAVIGALCGLLIAGSADAVGSTSLWAAIAGAVTGAALPSVVGGIIVLSIMLVGLTMVLGIIIAAGTLLFILARALLG